MMCEPRLEFSIEDHPDRPPQGGQVRHQTATFRPQELMGWFYWLAVLPFHWIHFPRMASELAAAKLPD